MINTITNQNEKEAIIKRQREDLIQNALYEMEQRNTSPSASLSRTTEQERLDDAYFTGRRIFGEIEQKRRQVAPHGSSETMLEALSQYLLNNIEIKDENHASLVNCLYTMGKNARESDNSHFTWKSQEAKALSKTYRVPIPEKAMDFIWDIFKKHREEEDSYLVSELKRDIDKLIPVLLSGRKSKREIRTYQRTLKKILEGIINPKAQVKLNYSESDSVNRNYHTHDWLGITYLWPLIRSRRSLSAEDVILEKMNSPIDEEYRSAETTLRHRQHREIYGYESEKDVKIAGDAPESFKLSENAKKLKGGNK